MNSNQLDHLEKRCRLPRIGSRDFVCGFSLVEVMVAMVIGMLGIIVMMQMFSTFEGQKRTTTGGDDAISAGAVSLYGMQRAIQHSGWGHSHPMIIGCAASGLINTGNVVLAPVTINPAGIGGQDANTDVLLIVSGNGNGTVEGDVIDSVPTTTRYAVHTPLAFSAGERVVAVPRVRPVTCTLNVASVNSIASPTVEVSNAAAFTVAVNDKLFSLGAAPGVRVYAVRNQTLTVCDYVTNNCAADTSSMTTAQRNALWVPVANNVVSLRAQYGRDTTAAPMDAVVDVWDKTSPATACEYVRASAVRVVLVARNSQPEKTIDWPAVTRHVTPNAVEWVGSDAAAVAVNAANAAAVAITLPSPDASWPTWRDFRYKVFQTAIPLRNVTTMGAVEGC